MKTQGLHSVEDFNIPSSDGASSLFVRHYSQGTPNLHFIIVHGALEHSGRHQDLTNFLLKSYPDVSVTVYDHIGHGKSGGTRAYLDSFKSYVDDLLVVGNFVEERKASEGKVVICSHSLGGLITLTRILDSAYGWPHKLAGLIFSSPCIKVKMLLGATTEPIMNRLNKLSPRFRFPMIYRGSDLTRDSARANDFDTDSLIPKFITVRMTREIIEATNRVRGLSYYLKVPSLFLIAGDDCLVDPEGTTLFAHGVDKRLVQVIQYPKHHHELWNEIDRQDIFISMKKWVDKALKESR